MLAFLVSTTYFALPSVALAQSSPRQSISINNEWRFIKGDPADAKDLSYDIRPVVGQRGNSNAVRESENQQTQNVIKAWILPSGNDFTNDPSKKAVRPEGNPGGNVTYVQSGFDDSGWELVNLPHDWAIGGPFIDSDGKDLSFITLRIPDSKGVLVPQAGNQVIFETSGRDEIVSTDNGDPTSFVSFHSKERQAFNGLALVIVRAKTEMPGNIKITAKSDGLTPAQTDIKS